MKVLGVSCPYKPSTWDEFFWEQNLCHVVELRSIYSPQAMANYFVAAGSNGFWRVSCDGKASFFVSIMKIWNQNYRLETNTVLRHVSILLNTTQPCKPYIAIYVAPRQHYMEVLRSIWRLLMYAKGMGDDSGCCLETLRCRDWHTLYLQCFYGRLVVKAYMYKVTVYRKKWLVDTETISSDFCHHLRLRSIELA